MEMPVTPTKEGPPASRLRNRGGNEEETTGTQKKVGEKSSKTKTPGKNVKVEDKKNKKRSILSEEQLKSQHIVTSFMELNSSVSTHVNHGDDRPNEAGAQSSAMHEMSITPNHDKTIHVPIDRATRTTLNNASCGKLSSKINNNKSNTPHLTNLNAHQHQKSSKMLQTRGATVNTIAINADNPGILTSSSEISAVLQGTARGREDMMQFTFNQPIPRVNLLDSGMYSSQPLALSSGPSVASGTAISTAEVYRMLSDVNKSLHDIKKEVGDMKVAKQHTEGKVDAMEFEIERLNEEIQISENKRKQDEDKIQLMSGSLMKFEQQMISMQKKITTMESRSMRANLLVSGIPEEEQEDCIEKCNTFLHDELKLHEETIHIKRAHRLGKKKEGVTRQMVMKLKNPGQKGTIFQNTKNLKGTNKYVNDQLPEEMDEAKRRQRQIVAANKKLPPAFKQTMQIEKGTLFIGEKNKGRKKYSPPIETPTMEQVLNLTQEEITDLEEVSLYKSRMVDEQNSKFQVYGAVASNKTQIRKYYLHLKIKHINATHISMVYRLAGHDKAGDEGYCDDGEYGLGRRLLKHLIDNDKKQMVFFAVRNYGGTNVNQKRFQIPLDLLQEVMQEFGAGIAPISKLKLKQAQTDTQTKTIKKTFQTVRGRRRRSTTTTSWGASPNLPPPPSTTRNSDQSSARRSFNQPGNKNLITSYMQQMQSDLSEDEAPGIYSCPTSATSNDENTEEEDEFQSVEEFSRKSTEDWAAGDRTGWTTDSQEEDGSQISTEVEININTENGA